MTEHFRAHEVDYREDDGNQEVVHEDGECIVVADYTGHELSEWARDFDVSRSALSARMHELARQKCDYSWSTSDPVVFDKFEEADDD
jgi:predicted transcriptional regulator